MYQPHLVASLAFFTSVISNSLSTSRRDSCYDLQIPVSVSEKRYNITATVDDDWDAAWLTLNLTRRDFVSSSDDPLPVAGETLSAVESSFTIGATFCGTGGPTLLLTHGIIESKL